MQGFNIERPTLQETIECVARGILDVNTIWHLRFRTVGAVYDRARRLDSKPCMVQWREIVRGHRPRLKWEFSILNRGFPERKSERWDRDPKQVFHLRCHAVLRWQPSHRSARYSFWQTSPAS